MNWIEDELSTSRLERRCTPLLASWVLSIIDRTLCGHYGPDYSIRCLQASECARSILAELGIQSRLAMGALCAPAIYAGPPVEYGWSGFWGDDHHVWLMTEFTELVDLTISQLHLHPAKSRRDAYPIPALWWHPAHELPSVVRYLPEGVIDIQLPSEEMEMLDRIRESALVLLRDDRSRDCGPEEPRFPIISNAGALNRLYKEGYPWVKQALVFQERALPFPPWVVNRESELMRRYR